MINLGHSNVDLRGWHVAIVVFAIMLLTFLWIGVIPYNDGAGWDGDVYIAYIKALAAGQLIVGDPYRSIRLSGFIQLIPFAWSGAEKGTLVLIQMVLNISLMSIGAGSLFSCLKELGINQRKAVLSVTLLIFSWAGLVMPTFYPVLSDNLALPFCCIAMWCWVKHKNIYLYIMCAWFAWLFPGLFLVPLGLIAFPYKHANNIKIFNISKTVKTLVFAAFTVIGLLLYYYLMREISMEKVANHMASGGSTGILSLVPLSMVIQSVIIILLAWTGASFLCSPELYRTLRLPSLLIGICIVAASHIVMSLAINFSTGFQGPPLLENLMMQGASAPLKAWVAHFLYFGFIVPLVAAHCIRWSLRAAISIPFGLLFIFIAFFPFLNFGSESRQWIGVLPVCIVIYALIENTLKQQVFLVFASAVSLFTIHGIRAGSLKAMEHRLGIQSAEWQYYFGRQGPWMSVDVYEVSLMALIAVAALYLWLGAADTKAVAEPVHP